MTSITEPSDFDRMKFEFTLTPEEQKRLSAPLPPQKFKWLPRIPLLNAVLVLIVCAGVIAATWNYSYGFLVGLILYPYTAQAVMAIGVSASPYIRKPVYPPAKPVIVTIDSNGVIEERQPRTVVLSWRQIDDIHLVYGFVRFGRVGRAAVVVPLRCFGPDVVQDELLGLLVNLRERGKGISKPPGVASLNGPRVSFISDTRNSADVYAFYVRQRPNYIKRGQMVILLMYFAGEANLTYGYFRPSGISEFIPTWLILAAFLTFITSPFTTMKATTLAAWKKVPGVLGPWTVAISPEMIELIHNGGTSFTAWEGVTLLERDKRSINLKFVDETFALIPKSAFAGKADEEQFFETAVRYRNAALNGDTPNIQPDTVWPPAPRGGG